MSYRWRRFYNGTILGRLTCERLRCGEQRVGLSVYCRRHVDELLSERHSWEASFSFVALTKLEAETVFERINNAIFELDEMPSMAGALSKAASDTTTSEPS